MPAAFAPPSSNFDLNFCHSERYIISYGKIWQGYFSLPDAW